jgi:hypothetical protein
VKVPLALALAVLWPTLADAVDLRARSTSASKQFVVFCPDAALRGRVTGFVEEVKSDLLALLGERNQGKIPIVVSLQRASNAAAAAQPVHLQLVSTPEGPTIQLRVSIGDDPSAVHLQKHIIRAILLDFIYRDRPAIKPGERYVEAPWWFIAGAIEKFRERDLGVEADLFRRLVETNKLPALQDLLNGRGEELGGTAAAFDRMCALALLQLLLEQPEAKPRLAKLIRDWPDQFGDPVKALIQAFPSIGPDAVALQKWWTLNLARFSASDRYRGLSAPDTDRAIESLLEFNVAVDKSGKTERFKIGQFTEFYRFPGARSAAAAQQKSIVALSTQANALLRPVLTAYEEVFSLLARGKTRGIAERIHEAEKYRTSVLHHTEEIADYLNWFEATQMGVKSNAFDGYLRAARAMEAEPSRTVAGQAIAEYLDLIQAEF